MNNKHISTNPDKDAENWLKYVTAVKQRDAARFKAEDHDRQRRQAWREYYALEKVIKEMNSELGLDEIAAIDDELEESKVMELPKTPKKRVRPTHLK